ncbi:transglycosylase domain-containing protein [Streptantibioticus ferralitis]
MGSRSKAKPAMGRVKADGKPRRRWLRWLLGSTLGVLLLGMAAFVYLYETVGLPAANASATLQANVYKTADGKVIARSGTFNREKVDISQIPVGVQHAFVAAENKTFYTDGGVDVRGMARGIYNTLSGRGTQGGSTITQQYVKNYYLTQNQTFSRKFKELFISLKVDQEMSKDKILEGYLNTVYFGRGAYGIQAAAQAYYGVDVKKLTVPQGAYLAALVQAPSQYDVTFASPEGKQLAVGRWNYVLNNMVEMHWLDAGTRGQAKFPQPIQPKGTPGLSGQTQYFVNEANHELTSNNVISDQDLATGGWTITLTIDPTKQRALEKAVKTQLTNQLDPSARKVDGNVQAGAASVDPKTGHVVALYGGDGPPKHYLDNATRQDYQVASTFKPIELASALENNAHTQDGRPITANTIYDGTSGRQVQGSPQPFGPANEDHQDYGNITVQRAVDQSVNSVFAQMAVDVGLDKVADTAVKLGMPTKTAGLHDGPAIALGTMGGSPLEMAGIYATLDNHGQLVTPSIVKSVERGNDKPALKNPIGGQAISRSTSDAVTSILTGVVNSGTGTAAQQDSQVAGKTGTSDDNKSAWFTGYTPDLVTSVGLFGEDAKTHNQVTISGAGGGGRVNGAGFPAQIWSAYTRVALSSESPQQFDLQTDQGAAVQSDAPSTAPSASAPPSTKPSTKPSQSPSTPPSHLPSHSTPPVIPDPRPSHPSTPPVTGGTGSNPPDGSTGTTQGQGGANNMNGLSFPQGG